MRLGSFQFSPSSAEAIELVYSWPHVFDHAKPFGGI